MMVASIGPFWDANETWLVLGVGILLVAFPRAHGVVLGALYLPVVAMLVGPDAARRRLRAAREGAGLAPRAVELALLGWARSLASFFQGVMLGRYITGFESGFGYCSSRSLVGASLCGGYVLLGATWLVLQDRGRAAARRRSPGRAGACCGSRSASRS